MHLQLIAATLTAGGVSFAMLQAHLKPDAKAAALQRFQDDPGCSESQKPHRNPSCPCSWWWNLTRLSSGLIGACVCCHTHITLAPNRRIAPEEHRLRLEYLVFRNPGFRTPR
jgi:hypothetical protein